MLLAACSTHYRNFEHPNYGQTEFDRDWYQCQRENSAPSAYVNQYYGAAGTTVNYNMAQQCIAARGWRPAKE
jgi:hypothetical protein